MNDIKKIAKEKRRIERLLMSRGFTFGAAKIVVAQGWKYRLFANRFMLPVFLFLVLRRGCEQGIHKRAMGE